MANPALHLRGSRKVTFSSCYIIPLFALQSASWPLVGGLAEKSLEVGQGSREDHDGPQVRGLLLPSNVADGSTPPSGRFRSHKPISYLQGAQSPNWRFGL
jgi:hypothetical protein